MSERLEHKQDSHSFHASSEHTFGVHEYQVKFSSDIQMHELQTFIGVNGDGFKGEFAVSKRIVLPPLPELFHG